MAVASSPEAKVLPAWKRLGLKLKNTTTIDSPSNGTSNKSSPSVDPNSKKRKAFDNFSESSSTQQAGSPATGPNRGHPLKRKKSVTFADNSKELDGDESSRLLADYAAQQQGGEGQFSNAEINQYTSAKVHPGNEPTASPVTKQPKKPKTKARQTVAESEQSPQATPSYVTYLDLFHKSRASWKFNKNHQTALLKNIFNPYRVPPEHDNAIAAYLQGLQGEAFRTRLKQTARTILDETKDSAASTEMPDSSHLDQARDKALKAQLKQTKHILRETETAADSQSAERQDKILKRRRAALVLHNLMNDSSSTSRSVAATATTLQNDDQPRPKKKSRRSRKFKTGVPDDDDTDETSSVSSIPSAASAIPKKLGPDGKEIGNADAEEWKWNGKRVQKKVESEESSSEESSSSEEEDESSSGSDESSDSSSGSESDGSDSDSESDTDSDGKK